MAEITGNTVATRTDDTTTVPDPGADAGTVRSTAERDRAFAATVGRVALAWGLLWTAIIAGLFLFGDAISALVV